MRSSMFPSEKGRARLEVPETLRRGGWLRLRGWAGIRLPFGAPSVSPSGRCERSGHSCSCPEQGRDQRTGWNEGQPGPPLHISPALRSQEGGDLLSSPS